LATPGTIAINRLGLSQDQLRPCKDFVADRHHHHHALLATIAGNVPANNIKEFVAYARANPASSIRHLRRRLRTALRREMFKRAAGLDIPVIFYKGSGPVLTDLLGGQVQITMTRPR
jgi:tripartite-type tricarboxylate transporter receptor subunit TctC